MGVTYVSHHVQAKGIVMVLLFVLRCYKVRFIALSPKASAEL